MAAAVDAIHRYDVGVSSKCEMSIKIMSLYIFMYFDVRDSGDKTRFNHDSLQLSVITVYTIISFPL